MTGLPSIHGRPPFSPHSPDTCLYALHVTVCISFDSGLCLPFVGCAATASLREHFVQFGEVIDAVVVRDAEKRSRGFGFVVFADPAAAARALEAEHRVDGRHVEAKPAVPREAMGGPSSGRSNAGLAGGGSTAVPVRGRSGSARGRTPPVSTERGDGRHRHQSSDRRASAPAQSEKHRARASMNATQTNSRKIFVGGLHYSTTEAELYRHFSAFGKVDSAQVMYNRETSKSRGFGFVVFGDAAAVDRALESRVQTIDGKEVEVKRSVPKADSPHKAPASPPGASAAGFPPAAAADAAYPGSAAADTGTPHSVGAGARAGGMPAARPGAQGAPVVPPPGAPPPGFVAGAPLPPPAGIPGDFPSMAGVPLVPPGGMLPAPMMMPHLAGGAVPRSAGDSAGSDAEGSGDDHEEDAEGGRAEGAVGLEHAFGGITIGGGMTIGSDVGGFTINMATGAAGPLGMPTATLGSAALGPIPVMHGGVSAADAAMAQPYMMDPSMGLVYGYPHVMSAPISGVAGARGGYYMAVPQPMYHVAYPVARNVTPAVSTALSEEPEAPAN